MTFSEYAMGLFPYISFGKKEGDYFTELVGNFVEDAAIDSCIIIKRKYDTRYRYIKGSPITSKDAQFLYDHRDIKKFSSWIEERMGDTDSYDKIEEWLNQQGITTDFVPTACAELLEAIILKIINPSIPTPGKTEVKSTIGDKRSESKKHPLPRVNAPDKVSGVEQRYVAALIDVYREKINNPDLTIDNICSYPDLNNNLKRHRDDYYCAEELRRGTRDIYYEDGEEYFSIFLDEIFTGVIEIFDSDYETGYARLGAVLTAATQTSTEQCLISRETLWIGNHQKKGACHILVNQKQLSGWV